MADEGTATQIQNEQQELRKNLYIIQSMIDVLAERLEGLRTQCATSAELTQQEMRTLEEKLIRHFSNQLVTKLKLKNGCDEHIPSLKQWLEVVGLTSTLVDTICQKIKSVEELQEKSDSELSTLTDGSARSEELNRLCRALHSLKRYTDILKRGGKDTPDMHLYWDSWDRQHPKNNSNANSTAAVSPRTLRSRVSRASVPSEESLIYTNNNRGGGGAIIQPSSSVSSINSLNAQCVLGQPPLTPPGHNRGKGMKFPTTPPACRKHLTGNQPNLLPDSYPLTKSKSHESQLAASKTEGGDAGPTTENSTTGSTGRRGRLPTEPGPDTTSMILTSPTKSPPYVNPDNEDIIYKSISLPVPKSPRTPAAVMTHQINHRFTKTFKMLSSCYYCLKPIYFNAVKCKECKYTCHKECEDKVEPSCGLPDEYLDIFKKKFSIEQQVFVSPTSGRAASNTTKKSKFPLGKERKRSYPQPLNTAPFPPPDSSSNTSSCNSSTPSSPAVQAINTPHTSHKPQFHFPDIAKHSETNEVTLETHPLSSIATQLNNGIGGGGNLLTDSNERTVSISGSTDSDRTPVRVDSQDSQVSDTETITDGHHWPRQNSVSMREWDIPYHEVKMNEKIGTGRFGTVYRGYWHGDVAVKVLNVHDEKTLEHFKQEVATYRKTRHENLILFMGACMKPPELAIVTSLSKGPSLYKHIHLRKDKFNMNKTTIVAQQISQGMGYLHAKGIVHKDLKSKNIFLENGKVVITDFGLFSVTRLCHGNKKDDCLSIPPGWLCYLSPEIMRSLRAQQSHEDEELPFSKASDVYAFGTVWYELLCGEWPCKGQAPEAIIWQVGKGMKQPLANLQASRDVKDILMLCWSFRPDDRPDFSRLLIILDKLPKKRLARSPSHPVHLSRSAESVF